MVEMLHPYRLFGIRCSDILAIHHCVGPVPAHVTLTQVVGPRLASVHASDIMKAKPSRRSILAGIAASPALAAPALALTGKTDAALFALEKKLTAAQGRIDLASKPWTASEEAMFAWKRSNPKPIWPECKNTEAEQLVRRILDVVESGRDPYSEIGTPDIKDDCRAALGEYVKVMQLDQEWRAKEKTAKADCRYDEIEAEWGAALDAHSQLCEEIAGIRADTWAGFKCKARCVQEDDAGCIGESIVADLRAIGGAFHD